MSTMSRLNDAMYLVASANCCSLMNSSRQARTSGEPGTQAKNQLTKTGNLRGGVDLDLDMDMYGFGVGSCARRSQQTMARGIASPHSSHMETGTHGRNQPQQNTAGQCYSIFPTHYTGEGEAGMQGGD